MAKSNPYNKLLPRGDDKLNSTFENLLKIQCTMEEIAGVFEVSISTLKRWIKDEYDMNFEQVYKIYGASGRASLRRFQMKQAEKNPIMGIWLGKQYLGQRDVVEQHNINHDEEDPLTKAIKSTIQDRNVAFSDLDDDEDDEE